MPDRLYIQLNYFAHFHRFANLVKPSTFNEKLNWLKLHDHNPLYTQMADKYAVKALVESAVGSEYLIPTIGVWNSFDEIDFDSLPQSFVLKCTHDSEGIVIIRDKNNMDKKAIKKKITTALKQNYYYIGREWPYKNIKPRIIAEPFFIDDETGELRDYKFLCFNGLPKLLFVASDRGKDQVKFDFFDMRFKHLSIRQKYPNSLITIKKPDRFDEMITVCKKLAEGIPHVRVDLYEMNGKVYFGELTLYHFGGFVPFQPEEWDKRLGEYIILNI